jgi:hypothetical protein
MTRTPCLPPNMERYMLGKIEECVRENHEVVPPGGWMTMAQIPGEITLQKDRRDLEKTRRSRNHY